jgi:hypothetical protein
MAKSADLSGSCQDHEKPEKISRNIKIKQRGRRTNQRRLLGVTPWRWAKPCISRTSLGLMANAEAHLISVKRKETLNVKK